MTDDYDRETEQFVKLCDFDNDRQKDMVLALLKKEGIPAFSRDVGAGSYVRIVTGGSVFGSKVFVPVSCQARATELLASVQLQGQRPFSAYEVNAAYNDYMRENPQPAEEEPENGGSYRLLIGFVLFFGLLIAAGLLWLFFKK